MVLQWIDFCFMDSGLFVVCIKYAMSGNYQEVNFNYFIYP